MARLPGKPHAKPSEFPRWGNPSSKVPGGGGPPDDGPCPHGNFPSRCDECDREAQERENGPRCPKCDGLQADNYYLERYRDMHRDETYQRCKGCNAKSNAAISKGKMIRAQEADRKAEEMRVQRCWLAAGVAAVVSALIAFAALAFLMPGLSWDHISLVSAGVGVAAAIPARVAWGRWVSPKPPTIIHLG